jgi:HAD superfamily hydrolase (TIGR01484 family)
MIGVDLDGTMLGGTAGRYGFLPAGIDALRFFVKEHQGQVAIVTGRDIASIEKLLEMEGIGAEEGWPHVIIAEERYIYHLHERSYIAEEKWNRSIHETERKHFEDIRRGVNELLADQLAQLTPGSRRVEGEVEEQRGYVELLFTSPEAARRGEAVALEWLRRHQLPYTTIRNVKGVSVRHRDVGKGQLLRKVCETLDIPPSCVLAVGDSANDLSMLDGSNGFLSAAPGNADMEVQAAVRQSGGYIANGTCGDGVAEAVYHFLQPVRTGASKN